MPLQYKIILFGFPAFCVLCLVITPLGAALVMSAVFWWANKTIKRGRLATRAYAYFHHFIETRDVQEANYKAMAMTDDEVALLSNSMLSYVQIAHEGDQKVLISQAREIGFVG